MNFVLDVLTGNALPQKVRFFPLETPAAQIIPILESLQRRQELPLWKELVLLSQESPLAPMSAREKAFADSLSHENPEAVHEALSLPQEFKVKTVEGWQPCIKRVLPALSQRVSLFESTGRCVPTRGRHNTTNDSRFSDDRVFPLTQVLAKSLYLCTDHTMLIICQSGKRVEWIQTRLTSMGVPSSKMQTLKPQRTYQVKSLWNKNDWKEDVEHLIARHKIDGFRIETHNIQQEINRCVETIRKPLDHTAELLNYLKHSADYVQYFRAFSVASGPDNLTALWCSGKSLEELPCMPSPQHQAIWQEDTASRVKRCKK